MWVSFPRLAPAPEARDRRQRVARLREGEGKNEEHSPCKQAGEGGRSGHKASHRGRGGMAVILKERHGWGLACAELLHLALKKLLLGLKLVLAAQCYLQPLDCLL